MNRSAALKPRSPGRAALGPGLVINDIGAAPAGRFAVETSRLPREARRVLDSLLRRAGLDPTRAVYVHIVTPAAATISLPATPPTKFPRAAARAAVRVAQPIRTEAARKNEATARVAVARVAARARSAARERMAQRIASQAPAERRSYADRDWRSLFTHPATWFD